MTHPSPSPVTDDEVERAAAALDHVASTLEEVHALSDMGDPAFDASMFGQISAVNRGSSLLRRASSDRAVLLERIEELEKKLGRT